MHVLVFGLYLCFRDDKFVYTKAVFMLGVIPKPQTLLGDCTTHRGISDSEPLSVQTLAKVFSCRSYIVSKEKSLKSGF